MISVLIDEQVTKLAPIEPPFDPEPPDETPPEAGPPPLVSQLTANRTASAENDARPHAVEPPDHVNFTSTT
jgi:hypothetical protein